MAASDDKSIDLYAAWACDENKCEAAAKVSGD